MTDTFGFELLQEREIPELNTVAKHYRHVKTGAEVLSLVNADENKVFGITFRTPPPDSTGLPHIMEHSVLCGSRKYPVKEPFVELVKGSLNTFLNAMTFADKTCYPVASQNLQDFYNLVDVYLDAVFHPRLTREVLEQEGWHFETNSVDDPLSFKGVVFNEMKGAYASPDNLVARYSEQELFPDTAYALDSGGDPSKSYQPHLRAVRSIPRHLLPPLTHGRSSTHDDPEEVAHPGCVFRASTSGKLDSALALQPAKPEPLPPAKPLPAGQEDGEGRPPQQSRC